MAKNAAVVGSLVGLAVVDCTWAFTSGRGSPFVGAVGFAAGAETAPWRCAGRLAGWCGICFGGARAPGMIASPGALLPERRGADWSVSIGGRPPAEA